MTLPPEALSAELKSASQPDPGFPCSSWNPPTPHLLPSSAEDGIGGGGFHHLCELLSFPASLPCIQEIHVIKVV